jgi:hypothetical protein
MGECQSHIITDRNIILQWLFDCKVSGVNIIPLPFLSRSMIDACRLQSISTRLSFSRILLKFPLARSSLACYHLLEFFNGIESTFPPCPPPPPTRNITLALRRCVGLCVTTMVAEEAADDDGTCSLMIFFLRK